MIRFPAFVLLVALSGCAQPSPVSTAPFQGHGTIVRLLDSSRLEVQVDTRWDGGRMRPVTPPAVQIMSVREATIWLTQGVPGSDQPRDLYTMRFRAGDRVSFGGTLTGEEDVVLAFLGPPH